MVHPVLMKHSTSFSDPLISKIYTTQQGFQAENIFFLNYTFNPNDYQNLIYLKPAWSFVALFAAWLSRAIHLLTTADHLEGIKFISWRSLAAQPWDLQCQEWLMGKSSSGNTHRDPAQQTWEQLVLQPCPATRAQPRGASCPHWSLCLLGFAPFISNV